MKKEVKVALIILVVVVLILGAILIVKKFSNKEVTEEKHETQEKIANQEEVVQEPEKPEIKIFAGDDRPIAFMIDNNTNAQPQASINSTYMVYEIIVEGGETRLMALFKGTEADEVGPIRSARHYFLDYAMENDALYAHLGMSPQAERDFGVYDIDHINGQIYDTGKARTQSSLYWRAKHKKAPHNAYTNTESILTIAKDKGWNTTSDKESVLNYVPEEVNLDQADSMIANTVTIPYSTGHKVQYKYDETTKRYTRYSKNRKMTDEVTKEDVTTKNIIITFARNYTLDDGENKGRQDVVTVGSLDGYYITNGKAIKIKCNKNDRTEQTQYVDMQGNEINVNDGNTWVNVCPIDANVTFDV